MVAASAGMLNRAGKDPMQPYFARYPRGLAYCLSGIAIQSLLPGTPFMREGIEVFPGYADRAFCDAIRRDADVYFHERLPDPQSGAFVLARYNQPLDDYDRFVFQIVNYHLLRPDICTPAIARLETVASARAGTPMHVASLIVQRDYPDRWTKRPLHSDGMHFTMKSFIYLNDVMRLADGPYVYVPASHRAYGRRLLAISRNFRARSHRYDDLHRSIAAGPEHAVLGPAGTMILSVQSGAHKGWSHHTGEMRDVLVAKLSVRKPAKAHGHDQRALGVQAPIDKAEVLAQLAKLAESRGPASAGGESRGS